MKAVRVRTVLFVIWQCTWGALQTLVGFGVFLVHLKDEHYFYHGAVVTKWNRNSSVSLGMFVFVKAKPNFTAQLRKKYSLEELSERLLVHEYGHSVQSLMLGPLYLIVIGIPSATWGFLPYFVKKRTARGISYYSFYTEKWANRLGEMALKKKSMENFLIG